MPPVFGAFLEAPDQWQLVNKYGRDATNPRLIHKFLRIRTAGDGYLIAPCDCTVSVKDPNGGVVDHGFPISQVFQPDLPDRVDLYVRIDWPMYLQSQLLSLHLQSHVIKSRTAVVGGLQGFAFLSVERSSLEPALAEALDGLILKGGNFGSAAQGRPLENIRFLNLTRAEAANMLAAGSLQVPVRAGHKIGRVALDSTGEPQRTLAVAVVSDDGFVDPLFTYDQLGDLVDTAARSALDHFGPPGQTGWPVISTSQTFDQLLRETSETLIPFPALAAIRRDLSITLAQWRQIRDRQKALFRARLLALAGHVTAGSTASPFEFDTLDWRNPFQLEAMVEFFANYTDPWKTGAVPREPLANDYVRVDFQNFAGPSVTLSVQDGKSILSFLASDVPMFEVLDKLKENDNIIELAADQVRSSKCYRVASFAKTNPPKMVLEGEPSFGGQTSSAWELHRRSVIVVVDCFGGRLSGSGAKVAAEDVIELDSAIPKVNEKFDTIYLASDQGTPSRAYRIVQVDENRRRVRVVARGESHASSKHPDLGGPNVTSRWRIPAGVAWSLEPLAERLGRGGQVGWDHFDGMLFVLKDGRVRHQARWSSYTSRTNGTPKLLSSIAGNALYRFKSFRSNDDKPHLNFCFAVADLDSGNSVRRAFEYFNPLQRNTGVVLDADGKTGIRIHHSHYITQNRGIWSSGCITSPNFASRMRDVMISLYQEEYAALDPNGNQDPAVRRYAGMDFLASVASFPSKKFYGATTWNGKINGWFWLIRPDELPEGWPQRDQ